MDSVPEQIRHIIKLFFVLPNFWKIICDSAEILIKLKNLQDSIVKFAPQTFIVQELKTDIPHTIISHKVFKNVLIIIYNHYL